MKRILENSKETREYLNSLPKAYVSACWAGWVVRGFPFSGKYADKEKMDPLIRHLGQLLAGLLVRKC